MDENISNDPDELYAEISEGLGEIANLMSQYMFSIIYDKVEEYSQINREFARILCNLVIISGIIIKLNTTKIQEKIEKYETDIKTEVEEFNENVQRFLKCFERKDTIDPSVWNYTIKQYFSYMKPLNDIMKNEFSGNFRNKYEEFKEQNNKIYKIIEKYKPEKINNIEYIIGMENA